MGKAAFGKWVIGFDTLVRDDPITYDFVLYNTPNFDVTTNDSDDVSQTDVCNEQQRRNSME